MSTYAIYHYDFRQAREGALKLEGSKETTLDKAQEIFEGLLQGKQTFPMTRQKRDGTNAVLDNEVLAKHGCTTLMLVCNEKDKSYMEKKEDRKLSYHPGCYVIIDNRDDVANIAIERNSAFESDPDKVCLLLQEAINRKLYDYRIEIEIRCKVREATVWQVVDRQTCDNGDRVTKVVFNFPIPGKVKGIDATKKMKKKLATLASIGRGMNATKASYHMEADKDSTLHLEQTQEDFAQMVELCTTNAYDIQVHFKYYGIYRFGADERAYCSLDDEILEDFENSITTFSDEGDTVFRLNIWLDNVRHLSKDYKDALPTPKKRKKRRK